MNAPASLTINFDSNIISITGPSNMSGTITTSGESLDGSAADGMGYKFTVALQDGYIIDSISTELNEYCGYLDRFGADYFWIVAESGGINGTITITSKLAVSRKSIDLTTLSGWSSLSSGSHSITIVAKADGYRDSEPSAAVSVEKSAAGYTITINNIGDYGSYDIVGGPEAGTYEVGTNKGSHTYHNVTAMSIRPYATCTISNGTGNFTNGEISGLLEFSSDSTATLTWID